jgi:integrase
MAAEALRAR